MPSGSGNPALITEPNRLEVTRAWVGAIWVQRSLPIKGFSAKSQIGQRFKRYLKGSSQEEQEKYKKLSSHGAKNEYKMQ